MESRSRYEVRPDGSGELPTRAAYAASARRGGRVVGGEVGDPGARREAEPADHVELRRAVDDDVGLPVADVLGDVEAGRLEPLDGARAHGDAHERRGRSGRRRGVEQAEGRRRAARLAGPVAALGHELLARPDVALDELLGAERARAAQGRAAVAVAQEQVPVAAGGVQPHVEEARDRGLVGGAVALAGRRGQGTVDGGQRRGRGSRHGRHGERRDRGGAEKS